MSGELLRVGLLWLLERRLRRAWRELGIRLGIRRITPRRGELLPHELVHVTPASDTGATYRPSHRPQDPAKDPHEPYGSESSSTGTDHGWSGCTMSAAADAIAYATRGRLTPWGGDMRHRQSDLSGGTDLWDVDQAFAAYGEPFAVKSGAGWQAVKDARKANRAIVIQGSGEVPGAGSFTGGHGCSILPETNGDGKWLFGDPLVTDWQWISESAIRTWAEHWQSSIAFGQTAVADEPDPEPEPEPAPPPAAKPTDTRRVASSSAAAAAIAARAERDDELAAAWLAWLDSPRAGAADLWDVGGWASLEELLEDPDPDPCLDPELVPASWSRGRVPFPALEAELAMRRSPTWDGQPWLAGEWVAPL